MLKVKTLHFGIDNDPRRAGEAPMWIYVSQRSDTRVGGKLLYLDAVKLGGFDGPCPNPTVILLKMLLNGHNLDVNAYIKRRSSGFLQGKLSEGEFLAEMARIRRKYPSKELDDTN